MREDEQATVLLVRNAAAHAGQIKRELTAIIKASSRLQNVLQSQLAYGILPEDLGQLSEPSVPDLADVYGQGLHLGAQEEAAVTPGEQQVPPKADDGRPVDTPLPAATGARRPVRLLASYPIHSAMQSDDDGDLSSEGSLLHAANAKGAAGQGGYSLGLSTLGAWLPVRLHPTHPDQRHARSQSVLPGWNPAHLANHRPGSSPHAKVASSSGFAPHRPPARPVMSSPHRTFGPGTEGPFGRPSARSAPRAATNSLKHKPKAELPAWNNATGGPAGGQGGYRRQSNRSSLHDESLQELKARFIARVQQANSARHTSRSKAFGDLPFTQLPGGQQLRERVPYTVLLNQSAAASMPAAPSQTWTTQVKARGHVQQEAVRWQAGRPVQSSTAMPGTFRMPSRAAGIDNQQAQPQGVSDLTTQQASMQQTHFVDENCSDQHSVLQLQQLHPLSTTLPGREAMTAVSDQLQANAHSMHADTMQQSHRLPGTAERPVAFAADTSNSTQGIVPLHTHISLDSFRLSTNDCQLDSYTQVGPASSNDTLNLHGSSLRGTVKGTAQMLRENTTAALTQQPMQLHTSPLTLLQQPQLLHADNDAAWGMSTNGPDRDLMQLPVVHATAAVAAQDRRDASSMLVGVENVPRRSSQRQVKARQKQAAEKGRAGRQNSRAKSAQPWGSTHASMGRAKSTQPLAGQGDRAAARALRQSGSFASPTRSSAAKTKSTGRDRTVTAVDSSSAVEVDFMQTQSVPAAPLMSTFRLGDLLLSNPPAEALAPTTQQQQKQQNQQPQQKQQQQPQQAQQQQAQQQPEQPQARQQSLLQQPSAPLDQQPQQQMQQMQQQPSGQQGPPTVSTSDVAEALGRLCQAATRKKQSAHGSKHASASSSRGSSPRQMPPSTSSKRNQSPRAGITASASNSGSGTPGLASSSKKNQSPRAGITASANNSGSSSPGQAPSSSRSWHAGAAQTTADGHESTASNSGHTMPALQVSVSMPGTAEGSPHAADTTDATCSSMFSSGADSQAPNPEDQSHDAATQRACTADVATDISHVADTDISHVAADDDADKAVPDQASSGSMQHAAAQSSSAAADQDQSEKAPESFQRLADVGDTDSKPESSSGHALESTTDRDAGDHGGVTPQPKGVQAAVDRVRDSDVVEMQSPNKSKYAQSQTWQAGVKMVDHPVGGQLLQAFPELASKAGSELLALLASGTDMRKAWEGGSGGSNRLMQCLVHEGAACIAYSHGWMRQTVQHTILRVHVPEDHWQSGQAITVDTSKGAIDLEPPTALDYAVWVLGLNSAMMASQGDNALNSVPAEQTMWCSQLNVMSN